MDFRQLQTFITVRDLMSFTKAADRLGYAQSSVTAQIQQLERELNARLFERIGKTITLTDAGSRLVPYALQLLQLADTMKSDVSSAGQPRGTLTVGAAESLSITRLPSIFSAYRQRCPEVELSLKLLGCADFLPCLARGDIDVAFTIGCRIEKDHTIELASLPETILVLAQNGHPLAGKPEVTAGDFKREPLLLTGAGCSYRGAFLNGLNTQGVYPKIALETDSLQAIKQAAMSGLGLCVLPAVAVTAEVSAGRLIPLDYDTVGFGIVSQLLIHKDKWRSPALNAFINLAAELFA
jgi:DNA-binding transcriptional LysR family regulator